MFTNVIFLATVFNNILWGTVPLTSFFSDTYILALVFMNVFYHFFVFDMLWISRLCETQKRIRTFFPLELIVNENLFS